MQMLLQLHHDTITEEQFAICCAWRWWRDLIAQAAAENSIQSSHGKSSILQAGVVQIQMTVMVLGTVRGITQTLARDLADWASLSMPAPGIVKTQCLTLPLQVETQVKMTNGVCKRAKIYHFETSF